MIGGENHVWGLEDKANEKRIMYMWVGKAVTGNFQEDCSAHVQQQTTSQQGGLDMLIVCHDGCHMHPALTYSDSTKWPM